MNFLSLLRIATFIGNIIEKYGCLARIQCSHSDFPNENQEINLKYLGQIRRFMMVCARSMIGHSVAKEVDRVTVYLIVVMPPSLIFL